MTLLTGDWEQLDIQFRLTTKWEGLDLSQPTEFIGHDVFDRFVNYLIDHVTRSVVERYDMPVYSADRDITEASQEGSLALTSQEGTDRLVLPRDAERFLNKMRQREDDKTQIVSVVSLLTHYVDDPRVRQALSGLVPLAFAGIVNDWDIYDEKGNLTLPLSRWADASSEKDDGKR